MSISLKKYETEYTFRGRRIRSYYGNPSWNFLYINSGSFFNLKPGVIPRFAQYRPDIISQNFFETPDLHWLIMLINRIYDPFEQMKTGTKVELPVDGD